MKIIYRLILLYFLFIFIMILSSCKTLPVVVEPVDSKDYVTLEKNQQNFELNREKEISERLAYSQTISLKKLQDDNQTKVITTKSWTNSATQITFYLIAGIIAFIGVIAGAASIISTIDGWFQYKKTATRETNQHQLLTKREEHRHIEVIESIHSRERIMFKMIDVNSELYIMMFNKLGSHEKVIKAQELAYNKNKQWTIVDKQILLVDKSVT